MREMGFWRCQGHGRAEVEGGRGSQAWIKSEHLDSKCSRDRRAYSHHPYSRARNWHESLHPVGPFSFKARTSIFWDTSLGVKVNIQWLDCVELLSAILVHVMYIPWVITIMSCNLMDWSGCSCCVCCLRHSNWLHRRNNIHRVGCFLQTLLLFLLLNLWPCKDFIFSVPCLETVKIPHGHPNSTRRKRGTLGIAPRLDLHYESAQYAGNKHRKPTNRHFRQNTLHR